MDRVDIEVAIVGAGAAGLAAAAELRRHGRDCLVLEARARLGGRAHTDTSRTRQPVRSRRLVHPRGRQGNPWAGIATARGQPVVADPRRRLVARGGVAGPGDGFAAAVRRAAGGLDLAVRQGSRASIGALLPRRTAADHFAAAMLGPWLSGEDTDRLDPADFLAARDGEDWLLPNGYGTLVGQFGMGLPVRLGCAVQAVVATRDQVELTTSAGRLRARHVIVTVPLGVLAAERIRFDPPLPAAVLAALDALPMGTLLKVGLRLTGDPFGLGDTFYLAAEPSSERVDPLPRPAIRPRPCDGLRRRRPRPRAGPPAGGTLREAVTAPLAGLLGAAGLARIGACFASDWQHIRGPWETMPWPGRAWPGPGLPCAAR